MNIDRYTRPEMARVWSDRAKYRTWIEVETAAAEAQGAPASVLEELSGSFVYTDEVLSEEETTRHDVVAFLQVWRRGLSAEAGSWVHRGMTSSDLVDSANALLMVNAARKIELQVKELTVTLARHSLAHRDTVRIGRTHGQHAEVTVWGHRVADFAVAMHTASRRLRQAILAVNHVKMSGPVGDFKRITAAQEQKFARLLDMQVAPMSTQVIMRDGYADLVHACAQVTNVIEAMATEVRLGQRSEVGELAEGFGPGQRGSSAMPHKRNPITSENLCGIARLVRAQIVPVMEGIALHNERDISHSSVERVAIPLATTLTHYAAFKANEMWRDLAVNTAQMRKNAMAAGKAAMSATMKDYLIEAGVDPDGAWELVHSVMKYADPVGEAPYEYENWDYAGTKPVIDWLDLAQKVDEPLSGLESSDTSHVYEMMAAIGKVEAGG